MADWLERTSGILHPAAAARSFRLTRYPPSGALAPFVARHWSARWSLAEPYLHSQIPYPCVNMAAEGGRAIVFGVVSKSSARTLAGRGVIFGVKFLPGGFRAFFRDAVAEVTDRVLPIAQVFGEAGRAWQEALSELTSPAHAEAREEDQAMIAHTEVFLRALEPARDADAEAVLGIVNMVADDRDITHVDQVVERTAMGKRTLQRLFREYVGVGPKWVIQRYRLHDAAERIAKGEGGGWARFAAQLGYADQAHFIRDFKRFVGETPARYAVRVRGAA